MSALYLILACIAVLVGFGCSIFIIVEAFRDELWKGFVSLLCGLYLLYFAVFDWDHDWKWPLILGAVGGNAIGAGLMRLAGAA